MARATVPVLVKDADGFYLFANQAAERLLGYEASQISGLHIDDLCNDDPAWVRSEFARFESQGVWNGSLVFRHHDGHLISAGLNAFVTNMPFGRIYVAMLHPVRETSMPRPVPILSRQRYRLTWEDRRLLQLLAEGFPDRDLAEILGRQAWAVSRDVTVLLQKMTVKSRTAACVAAIKAHLIV
jgi:PAS domain S-box-containing protein